MFGLTSENPMADAVTSRIDDIIAEQDREDAEVQDNAVRRLFDTLVHAAALDDEDADTSDTMVECLNSATSPVEAALIASRVLRRVYETYSEAYAHKVADRLLSAMKNA